VIKMTFDGLGALSDLDLHQISNAFLALQALPDEAMSALAGAVIDGLLLPECERRQAGSPARVRVVKIHDSRLGAREIYRLMAASIQTRDELRQAGRAAAAAVFDSITSGLGTRYALLAQEAREWVMKGAAEVMELERLAALPDEREETYHAN